MSCQQWICRACRVLVGIGGGWPVNAQLCPRCGKFMLDVTPPKRR